MFGERCKLYRYDDKSREWKERGVGELKILYHPGRKTYRLLLRREQVIMLSISNTKKFTLILRKGHCFGHILIVIANYLTKNNSKSSFKIVPF